MSLLNRPVPSSSEAVYPPIWDRRRLLATHEQRQSSGCEWCEAGKVLLDRWVYMYVRAHACTYWQMKQSLWTSDEPDEWIPQIYATVQCREDLPPKSFDKQEKHERDDFPNPFVAQSHSSSIVCLTALPLSWRSHLLTLITSIQVDGKLRLRSFWFFCI